MRVCIYTAIFGDCDDLKAQPAQNVDTKFVCFTDARKLAPVEPWIVIQNHRRRDLHPRMRAKYFKLLSHRVFPDGMPDPTEAPDLKEHLKEHYDYLIWIDGSAQIRDERFVERIISRVASSGWAMFNHPSRDCIYDEAEFSTTMEKYRKAPILAQVESYRSEGYPSGNGLMACGVIARDAARTDLHGINESWWEENLHWTFQDQLSLPVVLWRLGKSYDSIPGDLWENDLIAWKDHKCEPPTEAPTGGLSSELIKSHAPAVYNIDRIGSVVEPLNRRGAVISLDNNVIVTGWSVDPAANAPSGGVDVVVDGRPFAAAYGLDRPDVANHFRCPPYLKSGFSFTAPSTFFGEGTHRLGVRMISADKKCFLEGATLTVEI